MDNPLVNFIIIGAQKSGTTTIAKQLSNHPEVCISKPREPAFFTKESWMDNIKDYHKLFDQCKNGKIYGEGSTIYTALPKHFNIAKRIHEYNPNVKLIYVIRDPLDRAVSHMNYQLSKGKNWQIVENKLLKNSSYINQSRYFMQLLPYLKYFKKNQINVIKFEEYMSNQEDGFKKLCDYLEINYAYPKQFHGNQTVGNYRKKKNFKKIWNKYGFKNFIPFQMKKLGKKYGKNLFFTKLEKKFFPQEDTLISMAYLLYGDVLLMEQNFDLDLGNWKKRMENLFESS